MAAPSPELGAVRVRMTRDLGLFDVTMAAVGAMVGAAVFLLVGATYAVAGPLTLLSVLLAGFVVLLAGTAYAELASGRAGAAGGAYEWVRSALPAPSGFLSGWASWGGHMAASALSALGLGLFLVELLTPADPSRFFTPNPAEATYVAAAVLAASAALHFVRLHPSARLLGRATLVKILLILGIAVLGILSVFTPGPARGPEAVAEGVSPMAVVLGAGAFFIAFQGFEVIAQLTDQAKRPERTVPRGMLLAVLLSLLLYVLFIVAILGNVPSSYLAGWPDCPACRGGSEDLVLVGAGNFLLAEPWAREALLLIGVVSMFGALNANLSSAIRTSFSMARDRLLPETLAGIAGREVPPAAVAVTTLGAGLLLLLNLETIAILATLSFLLLFAFVHASVVALRRRERREHPGFRMPLVPALPLFAIALNLAIGATLWRFPTVSAGALASLPSSGVLATYIGTMWLAAGLIFHWFAGGRQALRQRPAAPRAEVTDLLSAEEPVELERYRAFLPLREFEDTELVDFGARVARARNGELSLLHVVEVPRNLPPKAIRFRYVDDRIRGLQKLTRVGTRLGVDTRPVVKIGSKVYEIILDTIRDEAVNLLVMGWRGGRVEGDRRILGSNIDYLIENAPCDVVVFKTQGLARPLTRIVILTSPIWSIKGVDDLALLLAEEDRPVIEVLGFAADPGEAERLKADAAEFLARAQAAGLTVEQKILYSRQWESMALQESASASLLMVRAISPGGLRKFALGPVEDRIVKLAKGPVLILRKGAATPGAGGPSAAPPRR